MVKIKQSKPIGDLKKGDKIKIDKISCEVDDCGILMEHKSGGGKAVAEMYVDVFDPKTDEDYQIRYFLDNLDLSLEVYELQEEFMWVKKVVAGVGW